MTDQDKRNLSERIAEAAQHAGLSYDLLGLYWFCCAAGHEQTGIRAVGEMLVCTAANGHYTCGLPVTLKFVPYDFTDPTYLYPLIQAWIDGDPAYRYVNTKWDFGLVDWECVMRGKPNLWGVARGLNRSIVEAQAFATVLESGKGEDHDQ